MLGILSVAILMVGYLSEHCPERENKRRRVTARCGSCLNEWKIFLRLCSNTNQIRQISEEALFNFKFLPR